MLKKKLFELSALFLDKNSANDNLFSSACTRPSPSAKEQKHQHIVNELKKEKKKRETPLDQNKTTI